MTRADRRLRVGVVVAITMLAMFGAGGVQSACGTGMNVQVFRCYNKVNGSHLYSATDVEVSAAVRKWPKVYVYEGPVYWAYQYDDPTDPRDIPLYRFYNVTNGSHFYTISAEEKALVEANYSRTYRYEGVAYAVLSGGAQEVHRFYNKRNGSHFYTISLTEKAYVEATWPDVYTYEGVAFYANQSLLTFGPYPPIPY